MQLCTLFSKYVNKKNVCSQRSRVALLFSCTQQYTKISTVPLRRRGYKNQPLIVTLSKTSCFPVKRPSHSFHYFLLIASVNLQMLSPSLFC